MNIQGSITLGEIQGEDCGCVGKTKTYYISGPDDNVQYTWSSNPSGWSGSGKSVVITHDGVSRTLQVTARSTICGTTVSKQKYIAALTTPPPTPQITVLTTPCSDYRRAGLLGVSNHQYGSSYNWSADPAVSLAGSNGPSESVEVPSSGYFAYASASNDCGASPGTGSRVIPATTQCSGAMLLTPAPLSAAPNPFSDKTVLSYSLSEDAQVYLDVATQLEKVVGVLVRHERQQSGDYHVEFDASGLPAGVYTARLTLVRAKGNIERQAVQLVVQR